MSKKRLYLHCLRPLNDEFFDCFTQNTTPIVDFISAKERLSLQKQSESKSLILFLIKTLFVL